jgi:argininosuccinate lyase
VKGLPLSYNRDLQEDKQPVFAARRDVRGALGALTLLVGGLEVDHERAVEAGSDPALLATDAAEALVREGVPFREAYERVAGAVRSGELGADAAADKSIAVRGAPGPGGVDDALAAARARLASI